MTLSSSLLFALRLIFPKTNKNSCARRSITGAIICIAISIVPLVTVLCVAEGMISGMSSRIIGLSTSHLQAFINRSYADSKESMNKYAHILSSVEGVKAVYPEINFNVLAAGKDYRTGAFVRAVEPEIFSKNQYFKQFFKVFEGDLDSFSLNNKNAVIGQKLAEILNLKSGDNIRIITTKKTQTGIITPKISSFKISAIISSGYQELDAFWIFIPLEQVFDFVPAQRAFFTIMIETYDAFSPILADIQKKCNDALSFISVFRWDELNAAQFQNFSSTRLLLMFIMILIVLSASVNISSALVMLVLERRQEIAIIKSLGGTSSGITFSFLITGVSCGISGVLLGFPAGLLCAVNINKFFFIIEKILNHTAKFIYILKENNAVSYSAVHLMDPAYYLSEIPVTIPFGELFFTGSAVIFLALAVSIIPAIKAGKENPLAALRKS